MQDELVFVRCREKQAWEGELYMCREQNMETEFQEVISNYTGCAKRL